MNIILIAPHPFYQERGTPIAVNLVAKTLCDAGHSVDLLTFHEGEEVSYPNLNLRRIIKIPFIKNIPIGFSWKKIVCDVFLSFYLLILLLRNKYDVIHAVEESIFPALFLNLFFRKKLIYDMDSSMVDQLQEKWPGVKKISKVLNSFENLAFKQADVVLPVCADLSEKVTKVLPGKEICILEDVAFEGTAPEGKIEDFKEMLKIKGLMALYVGNLEHYQGIDLLLHAMLGINGKDEFRLVIVGGDDGSIKKYQTMAESLQIGSKINFVGPRPFKNLPYYLEQADILISPRIKGKNTPMKIYSYLASGKAVLATNIQSHTQALDSSNSYLVDPVPEVFANGLQTLISNEELRIQLGNNGKNLAKEKYSITAYKKKLLGVYQNLESERI